MILEGGKFFALEIRLQAEIQEYALARGLSVRPTLGRNPLAKQDDLTIARDAQFFDVLQIGKATFRRFLGCPGTFMPDSQLQDTLDSFVEFRSNRNVYRCERERCPIFLLQRILNIV